jgi:cytoskeletal protein CcmA (bactofilin family)
MSDGTSGKMSSKRTLVEEGSVFKGSLEATCPIVVLGIVDGEVAGPSLDVRPGGQVSGRVKVAQLSSRGELAGNVEADTVELAGKVRDQTIIRARSIEVKLDRASAREEVVFGDCELCIGEELTKQAALDEAIASRRTPAEPAPPPRPVPPPLPPPHTPVPAAATAPTAPTTTTEVTLEEAALAGRRRRSTGALGVDLEPGSRTTT